MTAKILKVSRTCSMKMVARSAAVVSEAMLDMRKVDRLHMQLRRRIFFED
jgi:hypothetical protein